MSTTATTDRDETASAPPGRLARFFRFPLTWMLVGMVAVGLVAGLTAQSEPVTVVPVLGAALAVLVYWAVMRYVARRRTPEIAGRRAVPEALFGAAIGLGFVAASAVIISALGGYSFTWADIDVLSVLGPILGIMFGVAVTEELMFRGFAVQAIERLLGSWWALPITALFFGLTHLFNPGATLWTALAIAIEAGVLLGSAFLWRRNLWFVIGLHFAWNATVALLGITVSGHIRDVLFDVAVTGPTLLTGRDFGIEGSLVTVLIGVLFSVPMLLLAPRRSTLVPVRGPRP